MKIDKVRAVCLCVALLMPLTSMLDGMSDTLRIRPTDEDRAETHASGLTARVILADGTSRIVTLDGVGCSVSLCSKVFIRARAQRGAVTRIWIDTLAAVTDINSDSALFVMKDGTQQRLSLIADFRVLYLAGRNVRAEKIDLGKIRSLQMLTTAK